MQLHHRLWHGGKSPENAPEPLEQISHFLKKLVIKIQTGTCLGQGITFQPVSWSMVYLLSHLQKCLFPTGTRVAPIQRHLGGSLQQWCSFRKGWSQLFCTKGSEVEQGQVDMETSFRGDSLGSFLDSSFLVCALDLTSIPQSASQNYWILCACVIRRDRFPSGKEMGKLFWPQKFGALLFCFWREYI